MGIHILKKTAGLLSYDAHSIHVIAECLSVLVPEVSESREI